jgi:hypothetical protein
MSEDQQLPPTPEFRCGSCEQPSSTPDSNLSQSVTVTKPKRVRKPRDPSKKPRDPAKPPKAPYEPQLVGKDENGRDMFLGPMKGRYIVVTTKNGTMRKVYSVYGDGEHVDGEAPAKRSRAPRKRKAAAPPDGEPEPKEQKQQQGELLSAANPEEACLLSLLV